MFLSGRRRARTIRERRAVMNSMLKFLLAATAIVSFSVVARLSVAEVNMQEGNWETTMEVKMEGLPFPMPSMTSKVTQCITKKDLIPKTAKKDQQCDIKEQKITGNKVSWTMVCVDKNSTMESEGEITYDGNSYQGTVKSKTIKKDKPGQAMTSTVQMKGRRLGPCSK